MDLKKKKKKLPTSRGLTYRQTTFQCTPTWPTDSPESKISLSKWRRPLGTSSGNYCLGGWLTLLDASECVSHLFHHLFNIKNVLTTSNYPAIDGIELMIIVTATFAQTLSGSGHAVSIVGALTVWRFILGVGVGGDYPLSSAIASEFAPRRYRGRLMTAVSTAQGWGNFGMS